MSSWLSPAAWLSSSKPASDSTAPTASAALDQPKTAAAEGVSQHGTANNVADLSGQWEKDTAASDTEAYTRAVKLFKMSSLYEYAALHFMWGIQISSNDQGMDLKFLVKKVPASIFSEVEHFKFDSETSMGRRDRRSGQQTATLQHIKDGVQADVKWGEPYSGSVQEKYTLVNPSELHVNSTTTVGSESVSCLQVYRRK